MIHLEDINKDELHEGRRKAQEETKRQEEENKRRAKMEQIILGQTSAFRLIRDDKFITAVIETFKSGKHWGGYQLSKDQFLRLDECTPNANEHLIKELSDYLEPLGISLKSLYWFPKASVREIKPSSSWKERAMGLLDALCGGVLKNTAFMEETTYWIEFMVKEV